MMIADDTTRSNGDRRGERHPVADRAAHGEGGGRAVQLGRAVRPVLAAGRGARPRPQRQSAGPLYQRLAALSADNAVRSTAQGS